MEKCTGKAVLRAHHQTPSTASARHFLFFALPLVVALEHETRILVQGLKVSARPSARAHAPPDSVFRISADPGLPVDTGSLAAPLSECDSDHIFGSPSYVCYTKLLDRGRRPCSLCPSVGVATPTCAQRPRCVCPIRCGTFLTPKDRELYHNGFGSSPLSF